MIPKFRAYLKETETLAEVIHISFENKVLKVRHWEYGESTWLDFNQVELLQFTGLKDKNGKKIYEGDIVSDQYANIYTPIFRNGIYMAYNVEYLHLTEQEPSTQFNVVWKNGCEIIGNIYDNPELLEGEDE